MWIDLLFLTVFAIQIGFNIIYLFKKVQNYYQLLRHNKGLLELSAENEEDLHSAALGEKITLLVIVLITTSLICKQKLHPYIISI